MAGRNYALNVTNFKRKAVRFILFPFLLLSQVLIPKVGLAVHQPVVQLLFPPDKSLLAGGKMTLIGITNPAQDLITVTVKDKIKNLEVDKETLKVDKETGLFRGNVQFVEKGFSQVAIGDQVFSFLSWPKMISDRLCLDIQSEEGSTAEICYEKVFPHGPFLFDCEACHEVNQGKYTLAGTLDDLCYQCHDQLDLDEKGEQFPFVHGPLAFGDCLSCHDPHVGKSQSLLKSLGNDICLRCHDDKSQNIKGEPFRYRHPPLEQDKCTSCHDPHASQNKAQLTISGNDICTGCHLETHPYHRKTLGETLMTKVPSWFPRAPDGTMRCYGCHNPHGSDEKHMFIEESSKFCQLCHKI